MERNSPSNVLVLNTWQHIAGTYDGTWMRLYVNGKVVDSASATSNISNTGSTIQLTIGDHTGSYQRRFQGKIDEVRVWKACRTTAEIQANMYNEFCGPQKGLRAYYKFNQGKGRANQQHGNHLERLFWLQQHRHIGQFRVDRYYLELGLWIRHETECCEHHGDHHGL